MIILTNVGIYNGATGTVLKFGFRGQNIPCSSNTGSLIEQVTSQGYQQPIVYVQMDSEQIPAEMTAINGIPRVIAYAPVRRSFSKSAGGYCRTQLPLAPCHASTVHACQGMTAKSPGGVVYEPPIGYPFAMALDYVALSRCQQQDDLMLLRALQVKGFMSHPLLRKKIKDEYVRLASLSSY